MAHQIRKTTSHIRSSSWPTTSTHPLDSSVVESLLLKLTTLEVESSSSSKSICNNLKDIKNLYEEINILIQCSMNQKVLSIEENQTSMENVLEGSLALLDASSSINDVLSLMKQSIVELQSCLRRKSGEQAKGIDSYMLSRKKIQKMANKCLKSLQKLNLVKENSNNNNVAIVRMLREAEIVSFSTLKSVLAYFSETSNKGRVGH
ncbi:3-phosphoshikimate 1-carboxyvinyltransferase [Bienertia sinuspersici]